MNNLSPVEAHELLTQATSLDCIQAIEQQQQNLRALQQRITQLSEEANG